MKKLLFIFIISSFVISCNKNDELVLGAIVPLTGYSCFYGIEIFNALELCAEEWNAKGGIDGKKIVLDINDSRSDSKLGMLMAQKIMAKSTPMMIYSMVNGVTLNIQQITKTKQSILLACDDSVELFDNDKNFTLRSYINVGDEISNYLVENYKEKPLTILFINSFGERYASIIKKYSIDKGITVRQVVPYDDVSNYQDVIAKTNLTSDDILYIVGYGKNMGVLIRQLREQGYDGVIIVDYDLSNDSAFVTAEEMMDNVFFLDIDKPDTEEYNNFVMAYYSRYHSNPDNFAIIAYVTCGYLLDLAYKNSTLSTKEIMKIANSGYVFHSIIGDISVVNNEFVFPTKILSVK